MSDNARAAYAALRCDGTPHPPTAIPPLPFHAWRFWGDDPYLICDRCGQLQDALSGRVIREGDTGAGPAVRPRGR
jgi:hypothetical protein